MEVLTAGMPLIDIAPGTVRAEVLQNVACILSTRRGTVPYDRAFGLDHAWIDDPTPVSMQRCITDVIQTVHRYEPRARVESVEFIPDTAGAMEGGLRPRVKLAINEGGA